MSLILNIISECNFCFFSQVEDGLSYMHLMNWCQEMSYEEVDLAIPKFGLQKYLDAIHYIDLPCLSDPEQADFSGAITTKGVALTQICHYTYIEINEEGGEVEEAQFFPKTKDLRDLVSFLVDHPFIFYILDKLSSSIIGLGRYCKPE